MVYPYHYCGNGLFLEALKNGGVGIVRKEEARLTGRTLLRAEFSATEWAEAVAAVKGMHERSTNPKRPIALGPQSPEGSAPDTLPEVTGEFLEPAPERTMTKHKK